MAVVQRYQGCRLGGQVVKLALIPPIELLELTDETNCQLALPHLLTNETYRYVYQKHCDDPEQYVILDNGEAEGVRMDTSELVHLAFAMGVDELVVPDTIKDARATWEQYKKFLGWYSDNIDPADVDLNFMFVLQGKNIDEFFGMADRVTGRFRAQTIGIPRHAVETCHDDTVRLRLAKYIKQRNQHKEIHLLGGSPSVPWELRYFQHAQGIVRSTDTSSPFNFAYANQTITTSSGVRRPDFYFDLPYESFNKHALDFNIAHLKRWTREA